MVRAKVLRGLQPRQIAEKVQGVVTEYPSYTRPVVA